MLLIAIGLMSLFRTADAQTDSLQGEIYFQQFNSQLRVDFDLAQLYLDSMKNIAGYQATEYGVVKTLVAQGKLLRRRKKASEAAEVLERALEIVSESENQFLRHIAHYEYGNAKLNQGDYPLANEAFQTARTSAEAINDSVGIANSYNALGIVLRRMNDLDAAYNQYSAALPIYRSLNNLNGLSTVLLNLAIIDKQKGNYESSLALYDESLEIAEQMKPPDEGLIGYVYGNISSLHSSMKNYAEAIEYGKRSLEIRKKMGSDFEVANSYLGLAVNYSALGKVDLARNYLNMSEGLTDSTNWSAMHSIYKMRAKIDQKASDYQSAYSSLQKANVFRDSVYNLGNKKQIDELNTKFETEKKEDDITRLELQDNLNQARLTQKNILIFGLLGAMLIAAGMGVQITRRNRKINEQNKIISAALADKDTLLKEIHHRVKNNLQIISSLLGIQSRSVNHPQAKQALEEGRSRVRSMSLIHQNLYSKDNLTGIQMDMYLTKLARELLNNYKVSGGSIAMETNAPDLSLDVETVIPIGLIVNELVTNSLKYAFPDDRDGRIKIDLNENDDRLILSVSDNGIGLPGNHLVDGTDSFGKKLIHAFKAKLGADINVDGSDGTSVTLVIKNYKKAS